MWACLAPPVMPEALNNKLKVSSADTRNKALRCRSSVHPQSLCSIKKSCCHFYDTTVTVVIQTDAHICHRWYTILFVLYMCVIKRVSMFVCSHSEWTTAKREQSPPLLDPKEKEAGPVSAVCGLWTQRKTGECVSLLISQKVTAGSTLMWRGQIHFYFKSTPSGCCFCTPVCLCVFVCMYTGTGLDPGDRWSLPCDTHITWWQQRGNAAAPQWLPSLQTVCKGKR